MLSTSPRRLIAAVFVMMIGLATVVSATNSWGGYHWARRHNPFTLKVGDNVSPAWDQYLDDAINAWSVSSVLDLSKVAGHKPSSCYPTRGRIEVCNGAYGNTGWLGIAQIWITGGVHITQATTKLNDTYFHQAQYNTPSWRRMVMCQEVGHDFGLDHQDENNTNANLGTCMDYTNSPDGPPSNQAPNQHDYDQIEIIYAHSDATTTVGQFFLPPGTPPAMDQIRLDGPAQWGRVVGSSPDGRLEHYDLDFGGGHHVVTHVYWAR